MSIIYIHGVRVRDPKHGEELAKPFRRWLEPHLAVNGEAIEYIPVYWGDAAATFAWELDSRPKTALLKQGGAAGFAGLGSLREAGPQSPLDTPAMHAVPGGPVLGATTASMQQAAPPLASVPRDQRPDFLADLYLAVRPRGGQQDPVAEEPSLAALADAAATVAAEWDQLAASETTDSARRKTRARSGSEAGTKRAAGAGRRQGVDQ